MREIFCHPMIAKGMALALVFGLSVAVPAAFAQTTPPASPPATTTSDAAAKGCSYEAKKRDGTSLGIHHMNEGERTYQQGTYVTLVCHNGKLVRQ